MLSLPRVNADCERGFGESKHLLESCSSLCNACIGGLQQVKSYIWRYYRNAVKVPVSPELLRSVRRASARNADRIESRDENIHRSTLMTLISFHFISLSKGYFLFSWIHYMRGVMHTQERSYTCC